MKNIIKFISERIDEGSIEDDEYKADREIRKALGEQKGKRFGSDHAISDVGPSPFLDAVTKLGVTEIKSIYAEHWGSIVVGLVKALGWRVAADDPQFFYIYKGKAAESSILKVADKLKDAIYDKYGI